MKQIIQKIGMLMAVQLAILNASAYDFEVDGIYYNVISLDDMTCQVTDGDENYSGDMTIPTAVTYNNHELSVIAIETSAFKKSRYLISITIPDSIKEIGESAFEGCDNLTSVSIGNSVTIIGSNMFKNCGSLATVTIGNSVTEIGSSAFKGCRTLTSITIPDSVTTIGESAFSNCSSLISVTIPDSVTDIGRSAFSDCSSLISVTISNLLTEIESSVFSFCNSLTSVTIGNSVTKIGWCAFRGCSSLTSVTIPDSVTTIGESAFSDCSSLISVTIPDSVTDIGRSAFSYCSSLTSVTIGGMVNYVGDVFNYSYAIAKLRLLHSQKSLWFGQLSYHDWDYSIQELYTDRPIEDEAGYVPNLGNLEILEVGESVQTIQGIRLNDKLKSIESYALIPPTLPQISNAQYMNVNVFVPEEALETYKADENWGKFWNLQASRVDGVKVDSKKDVIGRYDLNGRAVSEDYQGLVIVRFSDGSCKKMLNR